MNKNMGDITIDIQNNAAQLESIKTNIRVANAELEDTLAKIPQAQQDLDDISTRIDNSQERLDLITVDIAAMTSKRVALQFAMDADITSYDTIILDKKNQIDRLTTAVSDLTVQFNTVSASVTDAIRDAEDKKSQVDSDLAVFLDATRTMSDEANTNRALIDQLLGDSVTELNTTKLRVAELTAQREAEVEVQAAALANLKDGVTSVLDVVKDRSRSLDERERALSDKEILLERKLDGRIIAL